ncbi:hypothetical protein [Coralloluteibacterium thermophilus]|uniref:Uncharacterized protein n=1 Tax=Coralloluteibacterium thermophilum TaxID=2707049 RepID=A0ABV9NKA4_9GAMM
MTIDKNEADSCINRLFAHGRVPEANMLRSLLAENQSLKAELAKRDAASAAGVPEGWALVPREPTKEMLDATRQRGPAGLEWSLGVVGYSSLLAAAPTEADR